MFLFVNIPHPLTEDFVYPCFILGAAALGVWCLIQYFRTRR